MRSKEIVGGTPASCGYLYDEETDSWVRPWNKETVPASDVPRWDKFKKEYKWTKARTDG